MRLLYHVLYSVLACVTFFGAWILLFSLLSHHACDPSFIYTTTAVHPIANWCGYYGAQLSAIFLYLFASASYFFIPALILCAIRCLYPSYQFHRRDRIASLLLFVPVSTIILYSLQLEWHTSIRPGGVCGELLTGALRYIVDPALIPFIMFCVVWCMIIMITGFAWVMPAVALTYQLCSRLKVSAAVLYLVARLQQAYAFMMRKVDPWYERMHTFVWGKSEKNIDELEAVVYDKHFWEQCRTERADALTKEAEPKEESVVTASAVDLVVDEEEIHEPGAPMYTKPDVSGLAHKRTELSKADRQEQQLQANVLEEKLKRFGIKGTVLNITAGPVVTLFEYQPQIDVPISRIIAREDDLALALQALSLRIIAPIPGRSVIGFEVSNAKRKTVYFAESVNSSAFTESDAQLPLIIGQNTVGEQAIIDLAKMPHLLVAGSTGSGKSVALNAMLLSLLCKATPDEVRMILIDPKRLEFAAYADIPHLLFPIVTDPKMALQVLQWAVTLMENRYEQMAAAGVRNIYDYRALKKEGMPYIVIVIDELADLMMVAGKDVENAIARLAQMARAAGIHLVLATQRPSVDVITGVVKVNFPARLACKVTSKIDSRTILDTGGAEKLLGKGDMLFLDTQGKINRLHGAYVSDQEIATIVAHVKAQRVVVYEELPTPDKGGAVQGEDAALYKELVEFVKSVDEVSISLLQRRFRIGYNRSARLIDLLESQGIIMPSSGSKTRKVLH